MKCYMVQSSAPPAWDVIITEWALQSYLDLKHRGVFSHQEYKQTIRPDVLLLKGGIPNANPKFAQHTFWGPAKIGNTTIARGFKMKWHNIGSGNVQLRLPVTSDSLKVFLCSCYEKRNSNYEQRQLAKFKSHINQISMGQYVHRGVL
jgi:hypothetical protein